METPAPVNLSVLKNILAKSKQVMAKVESINPIALSEATQRQIASEVDEEPTPRNKQSTPQGGYTREQVMASNLPPSVKEAMINSPIPQLSMTPSTFTLEDMSELEDIKMVHNKRVPLTKAPLRETVIPKNNDMVTISRSELKDLINESLVNFLTQSYNKTLTEDAIKKTINMLIKEGKISVKKK